MDEMDIRTRLHCLTALNIVISFGIGVVGYIGIERLHPERSRLSTYVQTAQTLFTIDAVHDELYEEALVAVGQSKAKGSPDAAIGQLQQRAVERQIVLANARANLSLIPLDATGRDIISQTISQSATFATVINSIFDTLNRGNPYVAPSWEAFSAQFQQLKSTTRGATSRITSIANDEHLSNISLAHHLQFLVVMTLAVGIISLIAVGFLTSRSIIKPIRGVINALGLSSEEVNGAAQHMTARSAELAQSATEQAAAVQQSVASMTEMSSMIAQTTDSSSESLTHIRRMAERTEDGNRIMERLASSTEAINQANSQLGEMVDIIDEISAKTSVINDIVFKTQLLSFNASIEAARAGQHGRGFAVVAEEFGNLAEMSGQAAKDIQALLETSKKQVTDLVGMTHQRVSDGQTVSKEALSIFNEISRETNNITRQIQRISDASREQQVGVQQTSTAMNEMDQAAQRSSQLASETLRSAADLSEQSKRLTGIMQGLLKLASANPQEELQLAASSAGTNGGAITGQTQVIELDQSASTLDSNLLRESANILVKRARGAIKHAPNADDENFRPYR
jgi:methyl-accepting chemotaxis protein